jgi:RNA polymerase sigma-70 factor (ECF subfamily)
MAVTSEQLCEQTLVLRSQLGDEAAFSELLALYGPRLWRFAERLTQGTREPLEDLTQEIWIAIYRSLPRLQDAAKFRAWAFRIARDHIFQQYRRRKLATQPLEQVHLETAAEGAGEDLAVDAEQLQHCLGAIAAEHREALVLRFFEEMSYEEIARVTGASIGTVRSRIHYGKRALQIAWKGTLL